MKIYTAIVFKIGCSIAIITTFFIQPARCQTVDITANPGTTTSYAFGTSLYAASENIYTETEIGAANFTTIATPINQVAFNINQVGINTSFTNVTIWIKEVPLPTTTFTSGTYTTVGYTQVFTGTVTAAATGWAAIPLTVPFRRTTGTNLQLLIERTDGVLHTGYVYESASGNNTGNTAASSRRYNSTAPLSGTTSLTTSAFRPQIRLQYVDPLPVTLLSFDVKHLGKITQLDWRTSQESNTKTFVIERSTDGRAYTAIGQISASGNSSATRSYSFSDNSPVGGISYYRLRIVDLDNSSKYSAVRKVSNAGSALISIYPNPSRSFLNVKINVEKTDRAQLDITDLSGKKIIANMIAVEKGDNLIPVSLSRLASGTYLIKITWSDNMVMRMITKQ